MSITEVTDQESIITVRVLRDSTNRDGWICRDIETKKVCFINNLDETIAKLQPGSLWNAQIQEERSKYNNIQMLSLIRA